MDALNGFPRFGQEHRDRERLRKLAEKYGILRMASEGKNLSVTDAIRMIETHTKTIEEASLPKEYYCLLK